MSDNSETFAPTTLGEILTREAPSQDTTETVEAPTDEKPSTEAAAASAAKATETAETTETKETVETKETERSRDEKGRFSKTDEAESLRKALQAERAKRQALEAKQQEKPKRDFWENPEAAIDEKAESLRAESERRFFDLCEDLVKSQHEDYDDVVGELLTDAESDPSLASQIFPQTRAARNPAQFLYNFAKNRRELKTVGGDIGKYRESVESPLKAELAKRDARIQELEAQLKTLGSVSSSLSTEQSSSRGHVDQITAEPTSMAEILKPKRRRA